jgi:hypothetical protein
MQEDATRKKIAFQLGALMAVIPLMYYLMLLSPFFIYDFLAVMLIGLVAFVCATAAIVTGFLTAGKHRELLGDSWILAPVISCALIPILLLMFVLMLVA